MVEMSFFNPLLQMLFHFKVDNVTFFPEDQDYFEKRLYTLKKFLGSESGDQDTVDVQISICKNKHVSGDRFECKINMVTPHHGNFHTEVDADTICKCADLAQEKLKNQVEKFHQKKL